MFPDLLSHLADAETEAEEILVVSPGLYSQEMMGPELKLKLC